MGRGKTGIKPAIRGGRGRGDDSNSRGEDKTRKGGGKCEREREKRKLHGCRACIHLCLKGKKRDGEIGERGRDGVFTR